MRNLSTPLRLELATGSGTYRVQFNQWDGSALTDGQRAQVHRAVDRALLLAMLAGKPELRPQ